MNAPSLRQVTTTITYALPRTSEVAMTVYDVLGRMVREFASGAQPADTYEVHFEAADLAAAVYFYRLRAGNYVETRKIVVVK